MFVTKKQKVILATAVIVSALFVIGAMLYTHKSDSDNVEITVIPEIAPAPLLSPVTKRPKRVSQAKNYQAQSSDSRVDPLAHNPTPIEEIDIAKTDYEETIEEMKQQIAENEGRIEAGLDLANSMLDKIDFALGEAEATLANSTTFNSASARYLRENYSSDVTWNTLKKDPVYIRLLNEDIEKELAELMNGS